MKLLFMDRHDVHRPWGHVRFRPTPFRPLGRTEMRDVICFAQPRPDGTADVFHYQMSRHVPWKLLRSVTADGIRFEDTHLVCERSEYKWHYAARMMYSPELERYIFMKNAIHDGEMQMYIFHSRDGESWEEHPGGPVFADGDVLLLSRMMTTFGAGAVVGALVVAWLGRFDHMGRALLLSQIVFGGIVAAFALMPIGGASYVLLFLGGTALLMIFSLTNSLVQLTVPDELRGRVISIYLVAFRGGMPLGSLVSGTLIAQFSAPAVIAVNGCLLSLVAALFLFGHRQVREL